MRKNIVVFIAVFIILGFLGWKMISDKPSAKMPVSTSTPSIASSTELQASTAQSESEKDRAWKVLQNYLRFAKNKNLEGVASLSYQLSDSCKNNQKDAQKECLLKIENVYNLGKDFKEKDFNTIWSDEKQIILSTDWKHFDSQGVNGLVHGVIYFVKDAKGNIKLLSFNPAKGAFITDTASSTKAEIDQKLLKATLDSDQDGLPDVEEINTDPHKRDSNGNGFWDGVEALFYKK